MIRDTLRPKLVRIEDALESIRDGSHVVASMAASEPQALFTNINSRCQGLEGVVLHCANPSKDYSCFTDDSLLGKLDLRVMFLTSPVRRLHGRGRVHYVPQHLSSWVKNLARQKSIDVFWGSCTPPDDRGFVSLGTGACYEPEVLRAAKHVVLEINPQLPVTAGATHVPLSWVDQFVECSHPLPSLAKAQPDDVDHQIARLVADLVENGSTIQLGIGGIPNAVGVALEGKRDLGVHTEMINDAIMDLALKGIITGRHKSIWPGKIVGAFVYGTRELYQFVNGNPAIELQPASVVNDPYRIGRNHRMVSINTAVEIDLTGQICSESIGHEELSGVGGAADTHVGAQRSIGGRGIVAMRSEARDGSSKIVFELRPGAKVSISRNDVDTVVTEHGVAELAGRSVGERVKAMINIAPPHARDDLLRSARSAAYL